MKSTCTSRSSSLPLAAPGGEQFSAEGPWQSVGKAAHQRNPGLLRGAKRGTAKSSRAATVYIGPERKEA